ncbi:MAG TPA: TIGR03792 family protein [Thermoanaerobaculia bacterium]|nr:TIGR03792 family protein [Thermoanaerobaculia bacterium]
MIIEWQRVRVAPELVARFLAADAETWTPVLAVQAGFAGKEVWTRPEAPGEVILVIRWESRDAWQAVPDDLQAEVDARCRRAVAGDYEVEPAVVFDVGPAAPPMP